MCTLSRDDTQSPINPAAATAARDKWKPRPAELPAPPPLSPLRLPPSCPPAVTVKVTQSDALCEGSALFIFHHRRQSWAPFSRSWRCPIWRRSVPPDGNHTRRVKARIQLSRHDRTRLFLQSFFILRSLPTVSFYCKLNIPNQQDDNKSAV